MYGTGPELYEELAEIKPASAQARAKRAAVLASPGRYEDAIGGFERALPLDPGLQSARAGLELARRDALKGGR